MCISVKPNELNFRIYLISNGVKSYNDGSRFCASKGMGLAVWNTAQLYEDMKYMASTVKRADLFTALTNENREICDTGNSQSHNDCDGKLVWRQTADGPCELFNAYHGFQG